MKHSPFRERGVQSEPGAPEPICLHCIHPRHRGRCRECGSLCVSQQLLRLLHRGDLIAMAIVCALLVISRWRWISVLPTLDGRWIALSLLLVAIREAVRQRRLRRARARAQLFDIELEAELHPTAIRVAPECAPSEASEAAASRETPCQHHAR